MPESFECRKGGLIQSSLLALECEMFGSLSSSVTGEVRVSFNRCASRNGSCGRINNHCVLKKKSPLMCAYNGRRAAVPAAPNDTELFIVLPKDLINKGQSYSLRHVSVFLLMFKG